MKELTKEQIQITKGFAILTMVVLHLFCRKGADIFGTPLIWINDQVPLVYYFGFLGEICVSLYCICSGYAHFRLGEQNKGLSLKRNVKRIFKFLVNFWIVCVLFTILGLIFDSSDRIPKDLITFLKNFFLIETSYNGVWWFATTYVYLVLLSTIIFKIIHKLNSVTIFTFLAIQYVIFWLLKRYGLLLSGQEFLIKYATTQLNNLIGKVIFTYGVGMLLAKENIMSKLDTWFRHTITKRRNIVIAIATFLACLAMCILEKAILVPFLAMFIFIVFNLWDKSHVIQKIFLFLGEHSTNIWLIHMFFFAVLFKNLVLVAKYPILIFLLLMGICIAISYIINAIYKPLIKLIIQDRNKSISK